MRSVWGSMNRVGIGILVALMSGLAVRTATPTWAETKSRTSTVPLQVISPMANGELLVTIPDPPKGSGYQSAYALTVPDGVQWRVLSVSFNLTTAPPSAGGAGSRRMKWVLRDPADLTGNLGRLYVIFGEGIGDYVYKDFSAQPGQNYVPGKNGPGTPTSQVRSPANAGLPDLWVPAGYQWSTVSEGMTDRDQCSFFFAIVEQQPL